ncbi:MAG: sulfotransferase domain-containing protein [Candidatus Paceibacterota bacterium]
MKSKVKTQADYWTSIVYDNIFAHNGIYVLGYTKSGTNWVRNLIRHYYKIDQDNQSLDFYRKRVHHLHRFLPFNYYKKNLIYMVRDGRDAIVSRYFSMINQPRQFKLKNDFISYVKQIPTKDNIVELLPAYIEFLKTYTKSSIDYRSHVNKALSENFFIIKYEDLQENTAETLKKIIKYLDDTEELDEEIIQEVVNFCSFNQSKERHENNKGFFRKDGGKSGTWRNYFNEESAIKFCDYANDILIHYGYEKNNSWVNDFKSN